MNAGIMNQTPYLPESPGNSAIEFCQAGISILEIRENLFEAVLAKDLFVQKPPLF